MRFVGLMVLPTLPGANLFHFEFLSFKVVVYTGIRKQYKIVINRIQHNAHVSVALPWRIRKILNMLLHI
jgi:hypothetical protein